MDRTAKVREILEKSKTPLSVNEILECLELGKDQQKYVSSILTKFVAAGLATDTKGTDPTSGRRVKLFYWVEGRADEFKRAREKHEKEAGWGFGKRSRAKTSRSSKASKDKKHTSRQKADTSWTRTKTGPTEGERKAAEEKARKEREAREAYEKARKAWGGGGGQRQWTPPPVREDAYDVFTKITGYTGRDKDGMKSAFRRAAMAMHPDRGGDHHAFAALSGAWDTIQRRNHW